MRLICPLLSFFLLAALAGCSPTEPRPEALGYAYFPLETGAFLEYDATETQYALTGPPTTRTYQIREVVGEAQPDATGAPTFRLERYRRAGDTQPWRIDSVWTARQTPELALRTENNLPFVKLIFPLAEGQRWDGNALNGRGPDPYELRELHRPRAVGAQTFDRTLTVVQQNDSTLVSLDRRTEIYAEAVGLVYRERTQFFYCNAPACLGQGRIDFGTQVIYRIRSYGKE
jgi:hypothetical protein